MKNNLKIQDNTQSLQSCVSVSVTDLRVGNYIYGVSDRLEIVTEILKDKITTDHYLPKLLSFPHTADIKFFQPVELSDKLLLKLGFVEVDYAGGCYQKEDITIDIADFNCCYKRDWLEIDVKYVHKLQNLYHALTGCDLQIGSLTEH